MKFYCTDFSGEANPHIDTWVNWAIVGALGRLPGWERTALAEAEFILLVVSLRVGYQFDAGQFARAAASRLPIVVIDFFEYHDPAIKGHWSTVDHVHLITDDLPEFFQNYRQLAAALRQSQQVRCYFKRELPAHYAAATGYPVYPIDFVNTYVTDYGVQSFADYMARPTDILMIWGYSTVDRPKLHGELMKRFDAIGDFALSLEDFDYQLKNSIRPALVLLHQPHYRRMPAEVMYQLQARAKITVSLHGCAVKCYRCTEAGANSLMAQQDPAVVRWAYPWHNGVDSLFLASQHGRLDVEGAVEQMLGLLKGEPTRLYCMYRACVEKTALYAADAYANDYLGQVMQWELKPSCILEGRSKSPGH